MTARACSLAALMLLGSGVSTSASDATLDLIFRCRSHDGRWVLAARDAPPTLMLFDAAGEPVKAWPVSSRHAQLTSRIAAIVDAPARRSFVVALRDIAELWEISYDPRAEDFYDGLVHDFRMGEGLPVRGFLNPRRMALSEPLRSLAYDPASTEVVGMTSTTLARINLDVRRRVASQPDVDAALSAKASLCP
jgi:hypothetical protein